MIKGVNIRCTDGEMKDILEFLVTKNNYQLPKDVVFVIKEDKPKFKFFKRRNKPSEMIENKQQDNSNEPIVDVEEIIIDVESEDITDEDNMVNEDDVLDEEIDSDNEQNLTEEEIEELFDAMDNNDEDVDNEQDINEDDLLHKLEQVEKSLEMLEEIKSTMEKTIEDLQLDKLDMQIKNEELIKNRNEILTLLKKNVEKFNKKEQDVILKLYFDEVEPEPSVN